MDAYTNQVSGSLSASEMDLPQNGYVPALDGIRAIAVTAVVLFHSGFSWFRWGYAGVDLFFVLSGYLITSLLLKERDESGWIDLAFFYQRRMLRLFPALAVLLIAFAAYGAFFANKTQVLQEIAIVMFYVGNWTRAFDLGLPVYLSQTWSLAVEEQYYLVWPVLLIGLLALTKQRLERLLLIIVVLAIAVSAWRATLLFAGKSTFRIYNGTDTRCDALLVGAALSVALRLPHLNRFLRSWVAHFWPLAAVCVVAIPYSFSSDHRWMIIFGYSAVAISGAVLICAATQPTWLSRLVLGSTPFIWIGRRSYALYLWHPSLLYIALQRGWPLNGTSAALEISAALVAATLSYAFVEQRFLAMRHDRQLLPRLIRLKIEAINDETAIPSKPQKSDTTHREW
jgi:peptidoglycan/LPS O-acetylase OafA/YrhL